MSEVKYLILENHIIQKIDLIIKELEKDIEFERIQEKISNERRGKSHPYEILLEELHHLRDEHRREYIETDIIFFECDNYQITKKEYVEKYFPDWKNIFIESDYEKHKKQIIELKKRLNSQQILSNHDQDPI